MRKERSDRGKKRKAYDSSRRKARKAVADIARTAEVVERKEKRASRAGRPRAERRRINREAMLPVDRVCPVCKKIKASSRCWVVAESVTGVTTVELNGHQAVCLSCYRLMQGGHDG